MTVSTSGFKQTIDPPILYVVESNTRKNDDVVEVSLECESATMKEVAITQKVFRLPRLPLSFPQRLVKKCEEGNCCSFISMIKQISINVPLIEASEKMSWYAKFMKDCDQEKGSELQR